MVWEQRGLDEWVNPLGETWVGAGTSSVTQLRARVAAGEKKVALAREFGISRETLYRYAPVKGVNLQRPVI